MDDKVMMKGNEALAEAAILAGCKTFFGYPITPSSEIPAYLAKKLLKMEDGIFVQAESEVAAINMVYGAAGSGVRVMTASSSPGISLKQEGISYIASSQLPCVIVNIVRGGPGLGNIAPAQSDYFQTCKGGGHGDYRLIALAPSSVQEMADLTMLGFDLADKYRNPVMIMSDGSLGQMMEPIVLKRPEPKTYDKSWATTGAKGRHQNLICSIYLDPKEMEDYVHEIYKKYDEIEKNEVMVERFMCDDADYIVVAYGITSRIAKSSVETARKKGIKVGLLRPITIWPFPKKEIAELANQAKKMLAVELSMGQMVEDVKLAVNGKIPVEFLGRTAGMLPTCNDIVEKIEKLI